MNSSEQMYNSLSTYASAILKTCHREDPGNDASRHYHSRPHSPFVFLSRLGGGGVKKSLDDGKHKYYFIVRAENMFAHGLPSSNSEL